MVKQILVPVDGSRFSEQAISYALSLAGRCGAQVHVAKVHSVPVPDALTQRGFIDLGVQNDSKYMQELSSSWAENGHALRVFCLEGGVVPSLASHIRRNAIDMVVMTTHGRGGLSRAWLGSVADRLIRATHVPLVLLRPGVARELVPPDATPSHILIPLDGSELSKSIIEPALCIGEPAKARYTLMQVVPPPLSVTPQTAAASRADCDSIRAEALLYLESCADELRTRGYVVATSVVMQAHAAAGIVEEAVNAQCDMIAMATHGRSGWSRIALGSVADKVIRSATAPLLTLRPAAALTEDTKSIRYAMADM